MSGVTFHYGTYNIWWIKNFQVQPRGGCISQVQKVLQTRLLEKLQRQNSEGSDTSKSENSVQISTSKSEPTYLSSVTKPDTFFQLATKNGTILTTTTTNKDANDSSRATHTGQQFPQFKATNILQVNHSHKILTTLLGPYS